MTNEGTLDRVIRFFLGIGILSLAFVGPRSAWGYIGVTRSSPAPWASARSTG